MNHNLQKPKRFSRLVDAARKFEEIIILILYGVIAIITVVALLRLGVQIYDTVFINWNTDNTYAIQILFGMTLTVLIALELGNSILRHLREGSTMIQAQEIILIGLMAVVRKVMLVDMSSVSPWLLAALAAVSLALAAAYWFTRDVSKSKRYFEKLSLWTKTGFWQMLAGGAAPSQTVFLD